jgi:hypothetical protein
MEATRNRSAGAGSSPASIASSAGASIAAAMAASSCSPSRGGELTMTRSLASYVLIVFVWQEGARVVVV